MKKNIQLVVALYCLLLTIGCQPKRDNVHVVYFAGDGSKSALQNVLENETEWNVRRSSNSSMLRDDSLTHISALVIPVSELNQLDHRAIPALKRYIEAGGGGILALRDTAFVDRGWPWLKSWLAQEDGASFEQDKGRLAVLGPNASDEQMRTTLAFLVGKNQLPNYEKVSTLNVPDSSRYVREVLVEGLDEPLQMALLPNNDVLFVERKGGVKLYEDSSGITKNLANLNVFSGIEDGLLGVAIDPGFEENAWVYFYYAPAGENAVNYLSRFELHGDSLALASEKVVLEIPTQRVYCCHAAGYLAFDKDGLLYLSTGDNTNAEETEGYTPVDERPGRSLADDQATAANTKDLRGKILRIRPLPDGTYEIPEGNLFPRDGAEGRPEIYTMGSRNPFRFSIDSKNGYVYWGDVGPDTKVKASNGAFMSFDEINQAREPGFFGWPYFLGNNEVFPKYNYETKKEEPGKDPAKPINSSPNNTGARELPPAKPAMIWYGKGNSTEFPLVGSGGASAMAGPVYYASDFKDAPYRLSEYYDKKLFIYEWIRGWILAVTLDDQGNYLRMEPFLEHLKWDAPVDMQLAADGSIYLLEYGTNWFSKNTNARLVRIRYAEGNRNPVADIQVDKQYGGAPLKVVLSGKGSGDFDEDDQLRYTWQVNGADLEGEEVRYTFEKPGTYEVTLTVADDKGGAGIAKRKIYVGNTPPEVSIVSGSNRSFYWDNSKLDYSVEVKDKEEKIDPSRIDISFGFIPSGKDAAIVLTGNQDVSSFKYIKGKQMIASLDCRSCHSVDQESVGPTYRAISDRYAGKKDALNALARKIIEGGSGNWGERAMTPHPAVSAQDAREMVSYILSLSEKNERLPVKGELVLDEHIGKGTEGAYLLNAAYRDRGANGIGELQSRDYVLLRSPRIQAEDFDEGNVRIGTVTTLFLSYVMDVQAGKYIRFNDVDLAHVKRLKYKVQTNGVGGTVELRLGGIDGPIINSLKVPGATGKSTDAEWREMISDVKLTRGKHHLYFVFNGQEGNVNYFNLDWIEFINK